MNRRDPIFGVILAGGLARRMGGGDKGLQMLGGASMLQRVIDRVSPQVSALILNANGDTERFAAFGLRVVADSVDGAQGPLAGVLAAMDHAVDRMSSARAVLSVPCDCPFLPTDLARRLVATMDETCAPIVCAASGGARHHVAALWSVSLRDDIRLALQSGAREVRAFSAKRGMAVAEWPTYPLDPFLNVNTPADLETAEHMLTLDGLERRFASGMTDV
jgi:molybdopterin-guanine dinucleotide biosynthesis protein A